MEIRLPNLEDLDDISKLEANLRKELPKLEGCVVCLDLSQCMGNLDQTGYRGLLRTIYSASRSVLVFRIPFLEQKALENIQSILDDVFFLRTITFVPMDFEDLSKCAVLAAKEYGYTPGRLGGAHPGPAGGPGEERRPVLRHQVGGEDCGPAGLRKTPPHPARCRGGRRDHRRRSEAAGQRQRHAGPVR